MEFKELKNKSLKELNELLKKNREVLRDLRFKVSAKQLKNIKEISQVKKVIARILTLINKQQEVVKTGEETSTKDNQ